MPQLVKQTTSIVLIGVFDIRPFMPKSLVEKGTVAIEDAISKVDPVVKTIMQ